MKQDAYIRLACFTVGSVLAAFAFDLTWLQQTAISFLAFPIAMPPPEPPGRYYDHDPYGPH